VSGHTEFFFGCPVASAQQSARAAIFFWLSGRIRAAVSPRSNFFGCPVASAQQCQAAQKFFIGRPVTSARLFLIFFGRMESLQF
jgi:hypothetical protein